MVKKGDNPTLIPPDGGYAWVIAFAHFILLGTTIPVQVIFGLLYRDVFIDLQFTPTEISVLMNVNIGVGQGFALFNAPLIRRYGYRKMAVVGTTLATAGMVLTSLAVTAVQVMIVYGITASLGFGMVLQSSQVAFNSYFKEKKSKAMGLAMTAVGVCLVLSPQLVVALLNMYGSRGACLIMSGVVMHCYVGTALLQPIKYHLKNKLPDPEQPQHTQGKNAKEKVNKENVNIKSGISKNSTESVSNDDKETEEAKTNDTEEPLLKSNNETSSQTKTVSSPEENDEKAELMDTLSDNLEHGEDQKIQENCFKTGQSSLQMSTNAETYEKTGEKKGILANLLSKIATVLDLSLLTNAVYANILVSMSLAFASETNFAMMTPLILASMGFTASKIATLISTISASDIAARFLTSFAMERFKLSPRNVYFTSIILLVIFRSILVFLTTFQAVMLLGVGIGIAKGIRNVNLMLVIPSYVPNERLASAIGIYMTFCAIIFFCIGPILGLVVEKGGDYDSCVLAINVLTLIAIVMWVVELVASRKKTDPTQKSAS